MKILICIDDTDNLTSKGTGSIAEELKVIIKNSFGYESGYITRHQLLIHDDIPYTSHNSSMCFDCEIEEDNLENIINICFDYLKKESAEGSDPGLAVAVVDRIDKNSIISFGKDAKRKVLSKKLAYVTAKSANVYLNEAGGTGDGVIGSLAGIGLRLWGNDGTLKAKFPQFKKDCSYTVQQFLDSGVITSVQDEDGNKLDRNEKVYVGWKAKPSMVDNELCLLVKKIDNVWHILEKQEMRNYSADKIFLEGCIHYEPDVEEEQVLDSSHSCFNCRYRRWMDIGILCQFNK